MCQGEYVRALMYFDRALELAPDYFPAMINRIIAETRQDIKISVEKGAEMTEQEFITQVEELLKTKYDIALELREVTDFVSGTSFPIEREPHTEFHDLRERALQLAEAGEVDDAIILLRRIVHNVPSDYESWHALGVCLDDAGQHAEALPCFEQALDLVPSNNYVSIETLNSKGEALRKLGRFAEAIALYDEVLKYQADHEFALSNKGMCLRHLDRVDEARDSYHRGLSAHPCSVRLLGNLGQLEAQQGNKRAALECCKRLKGLGGKDIMVHVMLSYIYHQLNKKADLLAELRKIRAMEPANPILDVFGERQLVDREFPAGTILNTTVLSYTSAAKAPIAREAGSNKLIKQCEHRVAVYEADRVTAEIPDVEGAFLMASELQSFRLLRTVYILHVFDMRDDHVEYETHVTDFGSRGKVVHIVTHGKGEVGMFALTEPIMEIVEVCGPDSVWTKYLFDYLGNREFVGKPFLYCHSNPLLVLEQLLREGCRIEWLSGEIGYQKGGPTHKDGVQMCLYWVNEVRIPMFHISDATMTAAIEMFCDEVGADEERLRRISPEEVETRAAYNDRSLLLDHPVFQYCLCGKTAATALSEARKRG